MNFAIPTFAMTKSAWGTAINSNPSAKFIGKYQLLDLIAVGGMAEIHKAIAPGENDCCIIKKIHSNFATDSNFIQMFFDEAKILAKLRHENIVSIIDFGKVNSDYFIVLEHVEGKNLRSILDRAKRMNVPIPIQIALYIAIKVLKGLEYAHTRIDANGNNLNIIHRDISPDNVILSHTGEVKIIDFGIAKSRTNSAVTKVGELKGKLGYMAPEQILKKKISVKSDIYSVGATLYELLTSERLFQLELSTSFKDKVKKMKIVPPSKINKNIPKELEKIILKAIDKNPAKRYEEALDFRLALIDYLGVTNFKVMSSANVAAFLKTLFPKEIDGPSYKSIQGGLLGNVMPLRDEKFFSENTVIKGKPVGPKMVNPADITVTVHKKKIEKPKKKFRLRFFILFLLLIGFGLFIQTGFNPMHIVELARRIPTEYHLTVADHYFVKGKYKKALDEYSKVDQSYLSREDIATRLSIIFLNTMDSDKAAESVQNIFKKDIGRSIILRKMGDIYYKRGDFEKARLFLESFKSYTDNEETKREVDTILSSIPGNQNVKIDEAKEIDDTETEKVNPPAVNVIEPIREESKEPLFETKEIVEKPKKQRRVTLNPATFIKKGDNFYNKSNYKEAIGEYLKALKGENSSELHTKIGICNYKLFNFSDAITNFKQAIKLDEKNKIPYKYLGLIWHELGDKSRALWSYKMYLSLESDPTERKNIESVVAELEY